MAELQTSFPLEKQPTLLDLMQQSQRVTGLKNLNLGTARQFQAEDASAARSAQLAQIRSQFTNPQTGQVDRAGYQSALNMSGMGSEADADQAGQYEIQQKKLESTVKAIDFSSRILGAAADHPEYRQQAVDLVYQISESIGGKKPEITADDPPEKFKYFAAQGLSYKDKLQMDFDNLKEQRLQEREQRLQGNFDATLNETKRAHDLTAQNSGWVQTVGKDGLPVWTQNRQEGTPAYSSTGISNKPLPTGQAKQVIGVKNLNDAADEYVKVLENFDLFDLAKPDERAAMGTVYNNMMLQAKEAYNLGVLNGPDYDILTSVITDPRSLKGAVTSNTALIKQATELKRIMGKIGSNAGQNITPENGSNEDDGSNDPEYQRYLRGE